MSVVDRGGGAPIERVPVASPRRRGVAGWVDPRGRRLGGWAFMLNRATGIGILVYLYLHLYVLSQLAAGPSAWNNYVSIALSPVFLFFDIVLIFGLLLHGLNGIRVSLVGLGLVVDRQRAMFVSLMVIGAIVLLIAAIRLVSVG